jgi:hypothetical protein
VFNQILNKVCFTDDTFAIEPQYLLPQAVGLPTIDFLVTYVVEVNDLPIFFLESIATTSLAGSAQTRR